MEDRVYINIPRMVDYSERLAEEKRKCYELEDILSRCKNISEAEDTAIYAKLASKAAELANALAALSDAAAEIGYSADSISKSVRDQINESLYNCGKNSEFDFSL